MNNDIYQLYFCKHVETIESLPKSYIPGHMLLIMVDSGEATITINGTDYHIDPFNFILLNPQFDVVTHKQSPDFTLTVVGFMMALQNSDIQKLSTRFFLYLGRNPVWKVDEEHLDVIRSFVKVYEFNCNSKYDNFTVEIANNLFSVFLRFLYAKTRHLFEAEQPSVSLNVRSLTGRYAILLQSQYKSQHNVAFYAEKLCVSTKHLTQVVKTATGFTPKEIIDKRLGMESLFLLTRSTKNVQEISNELGFPNQSYFGRFFKRLFGMSPLAYRDNPDLGLAERLSRSNEKLTKL